MSLVEEGVIRFLKENDLKALSLLERGVPKEDFENPAYDSLRESYLQQISVYRDGSLTSESELHHKACQKLRMQEESRRLSMQIKYNV